MNRTVSLLVAASAIVACTAQPEPLRQVAQALEEIEDLKVQQLQLGPFGDNQWPGSGENMPAGVIDDYEDPDIATHTVLYWKGADNQGTTLTGMDSEGVDEGDVRIFLNPTISGLDVGTIVLTHEDTESTAANRFVLPGGYPYTVPPFAPTIFIRAKNNAGNLRWVLWGNNGWQSRTVTQSLQLYPNIQVGTPNSPVSGTVDDWDPAGVPLTGTSVGIAGSSLLAKDHTAWRIFVGNSGLNITGLGVGTEYNTDYRDWGPVKVLMNFGPGSMFLKHNDEGSEIYNRILTPGERTLKIPKYGAVWLMKPYWAGPDPGTTVQWRVIATAVPNPEPIADPKAHITPSVLAASAVHDYAPTDNSSGMSGRLAGWWWIQGQVGTDLTGIDVTPSGQPAFEVGDEVCLLNLGSGLTVKNYTGSESANRFLLVGDIVLAAYGSLCVKNTGGGWSPTNRPN